MPSTAQNMSVGSKGRRAAINKCPLFSLPCALFLNLKPTNFSSSTPLLLLYLILRCRTFPSLQPSMNDIAPDVPPDAISHLLEQLTSPNPDNLRQLEAQLSKLLTRPTVLPPLLNLLCNHANPQTRHMAAILLRRTLKLHFPTLQPPQQQQFKAHLLARLPVEQHSACRRGLVALCTAVCRVEKALWPDLTATAAHMLQATDPTLRASAYSIFTSLCDSIPTQVVPHLPSIVSLVGTGLSDPHPSVRIAALYTYNAAAVPASTSPTLVSALDSLLALLPRVFAVALSCPDPHSDDYARVVCTVFEIITRFNEFGSGSNIKIYFEDSVRFALHVLTLVPNPAAISPANEFLVFAVTFKNRSLSEIGLTLNVVQAACSLVFNNSDRAAAPPEENEFDDDDLDPIILALRLLDALARCQDFSNIVFNHVMSTVTAIFESPPNPPHGPFAAAYRIIGAIADGCSVELTSHAKSIVDRLIAGAAHEGFPFTTRARALESLGLVCEALDTNEMPDDVTVHVANSALTAVIAGMRHPQIVVRKHSCMSLEPAITLFQDPDALRARVGEVIQALGGLGVEAAVEAVMAVGVLAEHASDAFAKSEMYKDVIEGTIRLMVQTADEDALTRAAALEAAGALVSACKDQSVIETLAAHAIHGLEAEDPSIKQATYSFFARMADTVGGSVVAVFGSKMLKSTIESMEREDIMYVCEEDEEDGPSLGNDANGEDEEENTNGTFQVRTAYMDEKMVATACIGAFASACASNEYISRVSSSVDTANGIRELFSRCLKPVDDMASYFHEDVRASAYRAQCRLAAANVWLLKHHPSLAYAGQELSSENIGRLVFGMREDEDSWVVCNLLYSAAVLITNMPAELLNQHKDTVIEGLEVLIAGKATCQMSVDEETMDSRINRDFGDVGEETHGLNEAVGDVIEALAHTLRGYFARDFSRLLMNMLKGLYSYRSTSRSQAMVLGTVAGVLLFIGWDRCSEFNPPQKNSEEYEIALQTCDDIGALVLPNALGAMNSTDSITRQRNAMFLVGIVFSKTRSSKTEVWKRLPEALSAFQEVLVSGKCENRTILDNSAGAVARIMMAKGAPPGAIRDTKRMWQAVINCVPLRGDPTENTTIARYIAFLGKDHFEFLVDGTCVQNVISCIVSAVLVHRETKKTSGVVKWTGSDVDPNDVMTCLSETDVCELVGLMDKIRHVVGESVFLKLGLSAEDEQSLGEIIKIYSR